MNPSAEPAPSYAYPASFDRRGASFDPVRQPSYTYPVDRLLSLLLLFAWVAAANGWSALGRGQNLPPAQQALLEHALANEYNAIQDASHPMRYELRKTTPRLSTTKKICETKDGDVALLVSLNDKPLSPVDATKEDARLNALLADPGKQRRRKQAENADTGRVLDVVRVLPNAFVYQYAGSGQGPAGPVEKFTFKPNPAFSPPNLETQVLTAMAGEMWIDPEHLRVVRLEGHLQQDVDFGWGILGRLNKGGWIVIEQANVGEGQWRTVHFQMAMSGRVVFKTRVFDTIQDQMKYAPVPSGLAYQKAIAMLRADP
jgi:hypothetical protein